MKLNRFVQKARFGDQKPLHSNGIADNGTIPGCVGGQTFQQRQQAARDRKLVRGYTDSIRPAPRPTAKKPVAGGTIDTASAIGGRQAFNARNTSGGPSMSGPSAPPSHHFVEPPSRPRPY